MPQGLIPQKGKQQTEESLIPLCSIAWRLCLNMTLFCFMLTLPNIHISGSNVINASKAAFQESVCNSNDPTVTYLALMLLFLLLYVKDMHSLTSIVPVWQQAAYSPFPRAAREH